MKTKGWSGSPFYTVWMRIKTVCGNVKDPRYPRYGGRGIKNEWKSFEEFHADMYESYCKHLKVHGRLNTTIERNDNDGNYCKSNCRWATRREQARNRANGRKITYGGETHSVVEWAEIKGLPKIALWLRLYRRKWPVEKALNEPLKKAA